MKFTFAPVVMWVVCLCLTPAFAQTTLLPDSVATLKHSFAEHVGTVPLDADYEKVLVSVVMAELTRSSYAPLVDSQYLLLVDRNPEKQVVSLAFYNHLAHELVIVGSSKTSTGNPQRRGFYETPVGVFRNTPAHMSYRALGTKNTKGWRGLGVKGSRVWDLGWQQTAHPKGGSIQIRLLIHASDPYFGEPRLGARDSQGCIRVSATLNRFLDHYSILDALYKQNAKASAVLPKNREPQQFGGSFVVVIDSSS